MNQSTCGIDGCGRTHYGRGWCQLHYNRWRKTGDPLGVLTKPSGPRPCKVDGCDGLYGVPGTARGYCGKHYQRLQKYGDPLTVHTKTRNVCSVDGCGDYVYGHGHCTKHYERLRRHGSLEHPHPSYRAPEGMKWCPRCEAYLLLDLFYKKRSSKDGLSAYCGGCERAKTAAWRVQNPNYKSPRDPEKARAASTRWRRQNPDKAHKHVNDRRARKRGVRHEIFGAREIHERDRWKCGICERRISPDLKYPHPRSGSVDHVVPLARGGEHTRANVQSAHLVCNLRKHDLGGGEQLALIG